MRTLLALGEEHDRREAANLVLGGQRAVVLGIRVDVRDDTLEARRGEGLVCCNKTNNVDGYAR